MKLYYHSFCPFSRKIRIIMQEKFCEFDLVRENFWERRAEFLAISPAAELPVLQIDDNGREMYIPHHMAIAEYLEESSAQTPLIYGSAAGKANIRTISSWFDVKMYGEVTTYIIREKVLTHLRKTGAPDSQAIRAAKANLAYHMQYIDFLLQRGSWLAGENITAADYSAAAQISLLDYFSDIPWEDSNELDTKRIRDWYGLMKSRPSMRKVLEDKVVGFRPPKWYNDPDF